MNAPTWLPAILAVVMLAISGYCVWRLAIARFLGMDTDYLHDAVLALLGLALAGMLVHWMRLFHPGTWAVVLAAAGIVALIQAAAHIRRAERPQQNRAVVRTAVVGAGGCAVAVYMLLAGVAPSAIKGSTAGQYTMAGMPGMYVDTTITYPALGLVFVVVLAGYAVTAVDRSSAPAVAAADRIDQPRPVPAPRAPAMRATVPQTPAPRMLAPRSVVVCQVAIAVTMAYAILAKLV